MITKSIPFSIVLLWLTVFRLPCLPTLSTRSDRSLDTVALGCAADSVVVDSAVSLAEALEGSVAPPEVLERMTIVDVEYYSSDSLLHRGQIVVDRDLEEEVREIFDFVRECRYPVEMVVPVRCDLPGGNTSMADWNNTYSFHYRTMTAGRKPSVHSFGRAIDFNPFDNPYIGRDGTVVPAGARYDTLSPRTLTAQSPLVRKMTALGWDWGGTWQTVKDYMHFEKSE